MPLEAWLLGNVDWSAWTNVYQNDDYELGQLFRPLADGFITGIRWGRTTTDPDDAPVLLRVWDMVSETVVYTAPAVPDDVTIGWQEHTLLDPLAVTNDRLYCVAEQIPAGAYHGYFPMGQFHGPAFPVGLTIPMRRYKGPGSYGLPDVVDTGNVEAIDVRLSANIEEYTWTTTEETDYAETLKWDVPADRYLLEVTTVGEWKTASVVEGLDVRRMVGFWSPLSGDYAGKRFNVDAVKSQLMAPNNRRMDGLLLDTGNGSAGHVIAQIISP